MKERIFSPSSDQFTAFSVIRGDAPENEGPLEDLRTEKGGQRANTVVEGVMWPSGRREIRSAAWTTNIGRLS